MSSAPSTLTAMTRKVSSSGQSVKQSASASTFFLGLVVGAFVMAVSAYFSTSSPYRSAKVDFGSLRNLAAPHAESDDASRMTPAGTLVAPHRVLAVPTFQEERYSLQGETWDEYEGILKDFINDEFQASEKKYALRELEARAPGASKPRSSKIPKILYQTGRDKPPRRENSFIRKNWWMSYQFYDDARLESFAHKHIGKSPLMSIWNSLERIVLKTDVWRYMVVFWDGGFYTDMDTVCIKPMEKWGNVDPQIYDLAYSNEELEHILSTPPQLMVAVEFDVPDLTGWETFWPRPIQIVQWTFGATKGHPVMLDATRRSMAALKRVKDWETDNREQAKELVDQLMEDDTTREQREDLLSEITSLLGTDPYDVGAGGLMPLLEATGPPAFTDAVFSYLQARWGVHWSQLHDIRTATRIGDVVVLPVTGFAPFERADWPRWKGVERGPMSIVGDIHDPQAMVLHLFDGSWRSSADDAIN